MPRSTGPSGFPMAAADPAGGVEGDYYYSTALKAVRYHNGTAWTTVGTGAGGAAASGVDAPQVQTVTAASSIVFAGLDGNTDEGYELLFVVTATSATSDLYVRPNGDTTAANYTNLIGYDAATARSVATASTTWPGMWVASSGGAANRLVGRALLQTKAPGVRTFNAQAGNDANRNWSASGYWADTTNNITSLTIFPTAGTLTGTFILRKIKAAATIVGGPRIVRGKVSAAGAPTEGTGFTVTKIGTGAYDVTFNTPFTARPSITVTAKLVGSVAYAPAAAVDPTSFDTVSKFRVYIAQPGTSLGTPMDSPFDFVAIDTTGASVDYSSNLILSGPRMVRGTILGTGAGPFTGTGFTAVRNSTGIYTLTWLTPFATPPIVTGNVFNGTMRVLDVISTSTTGAQIRTSAGGAVESDDFFFVAIDNSTANVAAWSAPQRVTALPAGQVDGFEVYFQPDPTGNPGTLWHLRYDATAAKWDCIGGTPLYATEFLPFVATPSTSTYTAFSGGGPSLTAQYAGTYDIHFGAAMNIDNGGPAYLAPKLGAATASANDVVWGWTGTVNDVNREISRAVAAVSVITLQAYSAGGSTTFGRRWLSILPQRIG